MTTGTYKARHTTGPWKFGHMMDGERWWVGQEYDRLPVAHVDRHDWPDAVVSANIRLIAAAPDLLDALRRVMAEADFGDETLADQCHAAIAKAEGE